MGRTQAISDWEDHHQQASIEDDGLLVISRFWGSQAGLQPPPQWHR